MIRYHEGQDVEVAEIRGDPRPFRVWRKAKIVRNMAIYPGSTTFINTPYKVQFPDGTTAIIDKAYIKTICGSTIDKWWLSDMAREWDEKLQSEGKP